MAERLAELPLFGICLSEVETNMIYLKLPGRAAMVEELIDRSAKEGVLFCSFPPNMARLVVCRNVEETGIVKAADILLRIGSEMTANGGTQNLRNRGNLDL